MIEILSGQEYLCSAGESFDSVALAVYGHEKYAPRLMDANPALCGTGIFQGGERLALPVIDVQGARAPYAPEKAPWR